MLPDRASIDLFWFVTRGRLRTFFSVGFLALYLFAWALGPSIAISNGHAHCNLTKSTGAFSHSPATTDQGDPSLPVLASPAGETSELSLPTTLRFDSHDSAIILWQPTVLASSRIIPQGLVLSFLCDSARHQCSGVFLA